VVEVLGGMSEAAAVEDVDRVVENWVGIDPRVENDGEVAADGQAEWSNEVPYVVQTGQER